ncbi:hypothetical protein [Krasilnikovia sp. M28-CT-15]|uniref:hypothetical protein n=1 Tax=Krasilnikovia sp. M28-CT-15 TaxID=3373540 RepID=UPI003876D1E1
MTGIPKPDGRIQLRTELAQLRRQRIVDEREGARLDGLLRAIAAVRSDRDAGVSPRMRDQRDYLERVWADAEDVLMLALRVQLRIAQRGGDDRDPAVHRARRACAQANQALEHLSDAMGGTL